MVPVKHQERQTQDENFFYRAVILKKNFLYPFISIFMKFPIFILGSEL